MYRSPCPHQQIRTHPVLFSLHPKGNKMLLVTQRLKLLKFHKNGAICEITGLLLCKEGLSFYTALSFSRCTFFRLSASIVSTHTYLMAKTLFRIAIYLHPSEFFFNRCTRPSNEGNEQQYPSVKSQLITRHSVTEPRNANNRGTNNVTSHASISEQVFIDSQCFCNCVFPQSTY